MFAHGGCCTPVATKRERFAAFPQADEKPPSAALPLISSLQRSYRYASLLDLRAPCIWRFLISLEKLVCQQSEGTLCCAPFLLISGIRYQAQRKKVCLECLSYSIPLRNERTPQGHLKFPGCKASADQGVRRSGSYVAATPTRPTPQTGDFQRLCDIASSRRTRSSTGGWVENSERNPPERNGLTINMCAVASLAWVIGAARLAVSSLRRALAR